MRGSSATHHGIRDDNSGQTMLGIASAHHLPVQYMGTAQRGAICCTALLQLAAKQHTSVLIHTAAAAAAAALEGTPASINQDRPCCCS